MTGRPEKGDTSGLLPSAGRSAVWSAGLWVLGPHDQAASEYGAIAVRDWLRWTGHAAQEHWYYVAGGVVLLVLLWGYLRK